MKTALPPGQIARQDFPRFGVDAFADFEAPVSTTYTLSIAGEITPFSLSEADLGQFERVEQVADFSCVTTWSYQDVRWSGVRFRDVFEQMIRPLAANEWALVAFRGLDGYRASLPLNDALADDVLLADRLNGEPLCSKHGAPLRLVAPAHYGYKNVKHLCKIELWRDARSYRPMIPSIMEHPRARVAYEERGRFFPGWFFRYLYRPLINSTVRTMNKR